MKESGKQPSPNPKMKGKNVSSSPGCCSAPVGQNGSKSASPIGTIRPRCSGFPKKMQLKIFTFNQQFQRKTLLLSTRNCIPSLKPTASLHLKFDSDRFLFRAQKKHLLQLRDVFFGKKSLEYPHPLIPKTPMGISRNRFFWAKGNKYLRTYPPWH